ncbi:MAG: Fe-S cluster assembly ATPase SufC [Candidatus Micrarchaeota archaeon]
MATLEIRNLHASAGGRQILKGVSLAVKAGEKHALMGPNGSGKSTLGNAIMGHPKYHIDSGDILLDGKSILGLQVHQRARKGIFLAFQYPQEIPGVLYASFLRSAYGAVHEGGGAPRMPVGKFREMLRGDLALLKMDGNPMERYLNEGFSGGEKKRGEILQMAVLRPKIAILDEPDSGLDIDAVKTVAEGVNAIAGKDTGVLMITHYQRILKHIQPSRVHLMYDGRIVRSGGSELALELEKTGYSALAKKGR